MEQLSGGLTAAEAADRLGVKPATLYAYVSRGVLARRRSPDGQSLFDPAEVERLARRGRPRRSTRAPEVVIESRITALGDDRPFYRGRDALDLAASASFETVAAWLWTGVLDSDQDEWRASAAALAAGRAASAALPGGALPLDRVQAIVPALAATDPLRGNLDPAAVADVGRALVAGVVDCLPEGRPPSGTGIAARLAARLGAGEEFVDAVRAALVLIADHELAASTLAARVAASVRADPYAVVAAGLATTSGALHGGASLGAEALLAEVTDPAAAGEAIGLRLRRGERVPGFGHAVYRSGDARGAALLDRVRAAASGHPVLAVAEALLGEARRRRLPEPNVDFALATLTRVAGMPTGAGEAIFAIARTAGWLAHAMEEYAQRTPLRLRAVYIGPTG